MLPTCKHADFHSYVSTINLIHFQISLTVMTLNKERPVVPWKNANEQFLDFLRKPIKVKSLLRTMSFVQNTWGKQFPLLEHAQ